MAVDSNLKEMIILCIFVKEIISCNSCWHLSVYNGTRTIIKMRLQDDEFLTFFLFSCFSFHILCLKTSMKKPPKEN